MSNDLTIPEEAEEFRFYCGCEKRCGRMGFELEGIDFFIAAELERLAYDLHVQAQGYSLNIYSSDDKAEALEEAGQFLRDRARQLRGES